MSTAPFEVPPRKAPWRILAFNVSMHALRLSLGILQYGGGILLGLWAAHKVGILK